MSLSNGANRDTELHVIVYQYWNTEEVVKEIEKELNHINGTPTTLTINLYHSNKGILQNTIYPHSVVSKDSLYHFYCTPIRTFLYSLCTPNFMILPDI